MVTERMIIMDMILVMATDNDRIMIIVIKKSILIVKKYQS